MERYSKDKMSVAARAMAKQKKHEYQEKGMKKMSKPMMTVAVMVNKSGRKK